MLAFGFVPLLYSEFSLELQGGNGILFKKTKHQNCPKCFKSEI